MSLPRIVPEVLRLARERRRITQRAMARALDTSQRRVAEIESLDGPLLTALWVERWARALGTTVAEILSEYDEIAPRSLPRGTRPEDPPAEPFAPPGPARAEQLKRLLGTCESAAQIARVVGVSPQRIRQVLAQNGLAR